jgi:hypothetical protein
MAISEPHVDRFVIAGLLKSHAPRLRQLAGATAKAEAALAQGRVEHDAVTAAIEMDRNALKRRSEAEEARRNKQKAVLRRNCGKPIVDRAYAAMTPVSTRPSRF